MGMPEQSGRVVSLLHCFHGDSGVVLAVTGVIELGNVFNPERRVTYSKHVHTSTPHVCI